MNNNHLTLEASFTPDSKYVMSGDCLLVCTTTNLYSKPSIVYVHYIHTTGCTYILTLYYTNTTGCTYILTLYYIHTTGCTYNTHTILHSYNRLTGWDSACVVERDRSEGHGIGRRSPGTNLQPTVQPKVYDDCLSLQQCGEDGAPSDRDMSCLVKIYLCLLLPPTRHSGCPAWMTGSCYHPTVTPSNSPNPTLLLATPRTLTPSSLLFSLSVYRSFPLMSAFMIS